MKNQRGMTIFSLIITVFFIGAVLIYGIPVGIAYINKHTIVAATQAALTEAKNSDNASAKTIKYKILNKVALESFDLSSEDVIVTKSTSGFEVDITFIKEIQVTDEIKLVVDLSFVEQSSQ